MGDLDLSSIAGMMAGSASGPVIAPGLPQRSLLWKMIAAAREAAKIAPEARNWWSFRKPVKVAPKIQNKVW